METSQGIIIIIGRRPTINNVRIVFPQRFDDHGELAQEQVVAHVAGEQVSVGLVDVIVDEPLEDIV